MGRKFALIFTALPFLLGWSQIYFGGGVFVLYSGRVLTGVGCGMVAVVGPMYVSETATKEKRGLLGTGIQLSITVGILLVYLLGIYNSYETLAAVGIVIAILAAAMTLRIPDTPRFLLLRNRTQEAVNALKFLRGAHADVEEEVRDIQECMESDEKVTWTEIFTKPEMWQPLKIAMGLMFFQQFTGINAVMFYTTSIFDKAGMADNGSYATTLIGFVQVAIVLSVLTHDRKFGSDDVYMRFERYKSYDLLSKQTPRHLSVLSSPCLLWCVQV